MAVNVTVVVPWRGGCPHRARALHWVQMQYRAGGWPVRLAETTLGPWVKADAVNPVVRASTDDLLVVADADVWCDGLAAAVDAVAGGAGWAIPHRRVRRLTRASTEQVLAGAALTKHLPLAEPQRVGVPGGGMVVLPRQLATAVPLDTRFVGWGGEDLAWGYALTALAGAPWRGQATLWHLSHPPQPRMSREIGSRANETLRRRYARAQRNPDEMRRILAEAT